MSGKRTDQSETEFFQKSPDQPVIPSGLGTQIEAVQMPEHMAHDRADIRPCQGTRPDYRHVHVKAGVAGKDRTADELVILVYRCYDTWFGVHLNA